MTFDANGYSYRVDWVHLPDKAKAAEFIGQYGYGSSSGPYKGRVPLSPKNIIGMTICRIAIAQPGSEKPSSLQPDKIVRKFSQLYNGYAFQHKSDPAYRKDVARKISFKDALKWVADRSTREAAWKAFLAQWPAPVEESAKRMIAKHRASLEKLGSQVQ